MPWEDVFRLWKGVKYGLSLKVTNSFIIILSIFYKEKDNIEGFYKD